MSMSARQRDAIVASARAAWPQIRLDRAVFLRHVAAHGGDLEDLHAPDLYLACAVAHGDPAALAAFDAHVMTKIAGYLVRSGHREIADEVLQRLRERLLVAHDDGAPRIAAFAGRGSLVSWVRMAAARVAIDVRRARGPEVVGDEPIDVPAGAPDPELDYLKQRYGHELREAFTAALDALPARDASILRLHFLQGMSAASIGAVYRVHGRTIQKWLAAARVQILDTTREILRERLQLQRKELESVIALAQSQLDVSLSRLLARD